MYIEDEGARKFVTGHHSTPLSTASTSNNVMKFWVGNDVLDCFDVHGATSLINSGEQLDVIGSGIKSGATPVAAFLQE